MLKFKKSGYYKSKEHLDFEPSMSLKEGTKNCIDWCKEAHKKGLFD